MQIVTIGNDLAGIEPPKSFRNAEDSVPYGALKENDKLKFEQQTGAPQGAPVLLYSGQGTEKSVFNLVALISIRSEEYQIQPLFL